MLSPACVTGFLREDLLKFLYGDGEAIAKASWLPHEVSSRLTLCLASQRRNLRCQFEGLKLQETQALPDLQLPDKAVASRAEAGSFSMIFIVCIPNSTVRKWLPPAAAAAAATTATAPPRPVALLCYCCYCCYCSCYCYCRCRWYCCCFCCCCCCRCCCCCYRYCCCCCYCYIRLLAVSSPKA